MTAALAGRDTGERCQVDVVRAMSDERGWDGRLFPPGHPLERLVAARWTSLCEALSAYDISLQFNEATEADDGRGGFRPSYAGRLGPGMELTMPPAGAYMSWPGRNRVILPSATDRTLVAYLKQAGFLGEVVYATGVGEISGRLRQTGRRAYSIDDFGDAGDDVAANCKRDMWVGNSKEMVSKLSDFAAPEVRKDMFEVGDGDFRSVHEPGLRVFMKTCNTETAGDGVYPVSSLEEFREALGAIRAKTEKYDLRRTLVLQPEIVGENKSFQVFLDPSKPDEVPVLALTDQLVAGGKVYAGSINHDITRQRVEVVGAAILDLVDRLRARCPNAVGYVMCDYFERADGSVVIYDPGLRPSSNTAAALVKRWAEEATGEFVAVTNSPWFDLGDPGMPYAKVLERLGDYADPDYILEHRRGVLPRGYNHLQGRSRFIIVTPDPDSYEPFRAELEELTGS